LRSTLAEGLNILALTVDPDPLPYGALDFYQMHYILKCETTDIDRFLAKCEPITKGLFKSRRVVDVRWTGSSAFADTLQNDRELTEMLKEVLLMEGHIRVDPIGNNIRIYGKWHNEHETHFNPAMAEVAERIAIHVNSLASG
jgi:hypothetical protein